MRLPAVTGWLQTRLTSWRKRQKNLWNSLKCEVLIAEPRPLDRFETFCYFTARSKRSLFAQIPSASMAKQRPAPRSTKATPQAAPARTGRATDGLPTQRSDGASRSASGPAAPAHAPQTPQRRSTYFEAVALYERGLEALQRHAYSQATTLLESVLRQYPEEKELHERV